jgi:hypothetical protein
VRVILQYLQVQVLPLAVPYPYLALTNLVVFQVRQLGQVLPAVPVRAFVLLELLQAATSCFEEHDQR